MSNTERQRRFRERNPGYYQRLHAKRRAEVKAYGEMRAREKFIANFISPPPQLCLPSPEQVSTALGDRLFAEIQSAQAARASAPPIER